MYKAVVIGGGYGGLRAIEFLAKYDDIEITLIDQNPYHYLQTEAYGFIAGRFDIHDVAIDLKSWCRGFEGKVHFVHDKVTSIHSKRKSITLTQSELSYDYLIVATGACTNFFASIEGLREHSHGVKNLERAYNFRKAFEELIHKKLHQKHNSNNTYNIAIGGAGLSGVEVAAEMAYVIQNYSKTIGEAAKDIKIYLIDAGESILHGMSDFLILNTQKRLEELGVNILTGTYISKVDDEQIYFKNGDTLEYSFMIFTGGIKASIPESSIVNETNQINQLITDETLNIYGEKSVFAIGDCTEIKNEYGNPLPPTAQVAEKSAEYVAKTIRKRIDGDVCEPFKDDVAGIFIALGGNYAVGEMFNVIKVQGYTAYLLKKAITYAYYLGLRLRINTGYKNRLLKD